MGILDKEEHEKIIDNTKTRFETTTDKELINIYDFPSPLSHITGKEYQDRTKEIERANIEMTRRLKKEIQRFNYNSSKYSRIIIWLTITLGIIALMQLIAFFIK